MFISFEGIDGAGKSSQAQWFAHVLESLGHRVCLTREPGGTLLGERLRALILEPDPIRSRDSELLLMWAARAQHLHETIIPALKEGKVVISDRFHDSTYAFQGGGGEIEVSQIATLDHWVGGPRPDVTFYFDLSVSKMSGRLTGKKRDHFESQEVAYHERVRSMYLERIQADPERFIVVNADQPYASVQSDLIEAWAEHKDHLLYKD